MAKTTGRSGDTRSRLQCGYCKSSAGDIKPCASCGKSFCPYHIDPKNHPCLAVAPVVSGQDADAKKQGILDTKITLSDLLKLGAIAAGILIAAKLATWFYSFLVNLYGKAKAVFKVQTVIAAALALAAIWALAFPGLAGQLGLTTQNFDRLLSGIHLPSLPSAATGAQQTQAPTLVSDLHDCIKAMSYAGPLENDTEERCVALCQERKYAHYGIVKGATSTDCYCCVGS